MSAKATNTPALNPDFGRRIKETIVQEMAKPYDTGKTLDELADLLPDENLSFVLSEINDRQAPLLRDISSLAFMTPDLNKKRSLTWGKETSDKFVPFTTITDRRNSSLYASFMAARYDVDVSDIPGNWIMAHARFLMGEPERYKGRGRLKEITQMYQRAYNAFYDSLIYSYITLPELKVPKELKPVLEYLSSKGDARAKAILGLLSSPTATVNENVCKEIKYNPKGMIEPSEGLLTLQLGLDCILAERDYHTYPNLDLYLSRVMRIQGVGKLSFNACKGSSQKLEKVWGRCNERAYWAVRGLSGVIQAMLQQGKVKQAYKLTRECIHLKPFMQDVFNTVENQYNNLGFFKKIF